MPHERAITTQGPSSNRGQGFCAALRIVDPAIFKTVRVRGQRFSDSLMRVSALCNDHSHPRLGLAIATKAAGGAVARNRLKRIMRESFRLNQHRLPPVDITISANAAARDAKPAAVRASLDKFWKAIGERCAKS